jgi:ABC-2 type transport system ATP-binding protein
MSVVIAVRGLRVEVQPHFWSRRRQILRDVSFAVEEGEIFGFLGPNGAGKTTSIKALLGLLRPRAGHIELLGQPPSAPEARSRTGFMPEVAYFPEQLTGRELLQLHGMLAGLRRGAARARVDEVLEWVGLTEAADRRLRGYSKGMLQRVGLGQALIGDPDVVVLDEPMSGLDPVGRRDIREIMLALRRRGKTVLFSTHILPDVEMICDRVGIIAEGQMRATGRLAELVGEATERAEVAVGTCPEEVRDEVAALARKVTVRSDHTLFEATDIEAANRMIDSLRRHGVQVRNVQVTRRSLEELFLRELAAPGEQS